MVIIVFQLRIVMHVNKGVIVMLLVTEYGSISKLRNYIFMYYYVHLVIFLHFTCVASYMCYQNECFKDFQL